MNLPPDVVTFIIGSCLVICSLMVGIREVLLRPENDRYPKAPLWLRSVLFGYCITLFAVGSTALFSLERGQPMVSDNGVLMLLAIWMVLHHSASTLWFLTQRHPRPFRAQVHDFAAAALHLGQSARRVSKVRHSD